MKGYKKILLISLLIMIILIINNFLQIFNLFTYSFFLFIAFFIVKKLMGFDYDDFPDKKEIMIIVGSS
ncbi:MAG: hypothetical protein GX861_03930, partial [Tenericutes bacterium]|nr:hypothetical protein [Mycoplasmatota bacterium]